MKHAHLVGKYHHNARRSRLVNVNQPHQGVCMGTDDVDRMVRWHPEALQVYLTDTAQQIAILQRKHAAAKAAQDRQQKLAPLYPVDED